MVHTHMADRPFTKPFRVVSFFAGEPLINTCKGCLATSHPSAQEMKTARHETVYEFCNPRGPDVSAKVPPNIGHAIKTVPASSLSGWKIYAWAR